MSFSEGASFLVRAMEHDKEAVPGLQEHSQLFWCISRCLAVLLLPSLKGSLPHPVTERFPLEKAKIVPSFIYKEEHWGKEEVTEKINWDRRTNHSLCSKVRPSLSMHSGWRVQSCIILGTLRCFFVIINDTMIKIIRLSAGMNKKIKSNFRVRQDLNVALGLIA